jgi:hypothetical protein
MGLQNFIGKIAADQQWLTSKFIQLHSAFPSKNDIMLDRHQAGGIIFDGTQWRELDLGNLRKAANEICLHSEKNVCFSDTSE